jgi:hypothetical protein
LRRRRLLLNPSAASRVSNSRIAGVRLGIRFWSESRQATQLLAAEDYLKTLGTLWSRLHD